MIASAIIGGALVIINVAFWLLSAKYFSDKTSGILAAKFGPDELMNWRIAFAIFSASVGAASIGTLFIPKWIGHGLAVIAGGGALVCSYFAFAQSMPLALPVALLVVGIVFPLLVWRSLANSRPAWAFLVAMCFVLGLVLAFGAPKIRATMGIGLWTAMMIPGLLVVAGVALAGLGRQYRDRGY
jgi:hypothetical protein